MPIQERVRFWREFVARPLRVGSVTPSSAALAREMVAAVEWERAGSVVEWGPGTGAFTPAILERLRPAARFLAIELNPNLARALRRRFPEVALHEGSAADVEAVAAEAGMAPVDCILSSLPWAAFPQALQSEILAAGRSVLREGGQFVTFAYLQGTVLPAGRRFRALLETTFSEVTRGRAVWGNLPPAFVYRCRR